MTTGADRRAGAADISPETQAPSPVGGLWRALDYYRPLALLFAVLLVWGQRDSMRRPMVAVVVLAALAVWSFVVPMVRRRDGWLLGIELALACAGVLLTPLALGDRGSTGGTLPALWAAAPVMGWAVLRGLAGGVLAAVVVAVADVIEVGQPTEGTAYNIVTLLLLGGCLGAGADLARRGQRDLAEALRVRAENAERDRLARAIHDGVLQALTFIHRRGDQIGGEAALLGALAAEQERELRALALGPSAPARGGISDLRVVLGRLASDVVTVSSPAGGIRMPTARAEELAAAVTAALSNVSAHAGEGARAWVLVEDLGSDVVVTVRDDGVGYAPDRLARAAEDGRLGVASSIDGRVRDLGGRVTHRSVPGTGTTVEITVPLRAPSKEMP